jgi:hypothetical protein
MKPVEPVQRAIRSSARRWSPPRSGQTRLIELDQKYVE